MKARWLQYPRLSSIRPLTGMQVSGMGIPAGIKRGLSNSLESLYASAISTFDA